MTLFQKKRHPRLLHYNFKFFLVIYNYVHTEGEISPFFPSDSTFFLASIFRRFCTDATIFPAFLFLLKFLWQWDVFSFQFFRKFFSTIQFFLDFYSCFSFYLNLYLHFNFAWNLYSDSIFSFMKLPWITDHMSHNFTTLTDEIILLKATNNYKWRISS